MQCACLLVNVRRTRLCTGLMVLLLVLWSSLGHMVVSRTKYLGEGSCASAYLCAKYGFAAFHLLLLSTVYGCGVATRQPCADAVPAPVHPSSKFGVVLFQFPEGFQQSMLHHPAAPPPANCGWQ